MLGLLLLVQMREDVWLKRGTGTTGKMTTYLFIVIVVTRKLLHKQFHRWRRDFPTWKRA